MNFNKKELGSFIRTVCNEMQWTEILYAGIVGSVLVMKRDRDIDVIVVTKITPKEPSLIHLQRVSILAFSKDWLKYNKHLEKPTGLVPSILFKALELSEPLIGKKSDLGLPIIHACEPDWVNIEIKKERYKNRDRKNYLVALLFEKLLAISSDLSKYSFDNVEMAKSIGEKQIASDLLKFYNRTMKRNRNNLTKFRRENQKERNRFIDQWAEYVRTHDDKDWSRQQNVIINSCIRTASMTKEEYLAMKNIDQDIKAGKKVKKFNQKDAVKYLKNL
jgi:hypothetical protein